MVEFTKAHLNYNIAKVTQHLKSCSTQFNTFAYTLLCRNIQEYTNIFVLNWQYLLYQIDLLVVVPNGVDV